MGLKKGMRNNAPIFRARNRKYMLPIGQDVVLRRREDTQMIKLPTEKRHLQIFHAKLLQGKSPQAVNVNQVDSEFKVSLGFNGKVATVLTSVYGSMWFVYFLVLATAGWMLWQGYVDKRPFDPYPFAFLLFIGNLIQLVGGPIIQVGQNLASAHSELRAEADYHVNKASFEQLEQIDQAELTLSKHIEQQNELLLQLMQRQGKQHEELLRRLSEKG
jgi:uncharacterized membrane protein